MANVDLFNAAVAGLIIGWFARDVLRSLRVIRRRLARARKEWAKS